VQDSVYGYLPSKPVNLILLGLFAIAFFAHLWQSIKWKSWTFFIALGVGTAGEVIGMFDLSEAFLATVLITERRIRGSPQVA